MNTEDRLRQIRIENYIWIIYIFLIILCFISNKYEADYFKNNNLNSKEIYRYINIFVFSVAIIVYLYFVLNDYDSVKKLNIFDSKEKIDLTNLSLLGSILILISGIIFLYILYKDKDIETEIAFN